MLTLKTVKNITFYIPGPVNSAKFLLGGAAGSGFIPTYSADVVNK